MKKIIICTLMLYCLLNTTNQVIASNFNVETSKYSDKYIQWLGLSEEEKAKTIPPAMYVKEINTNNNLAKRNIRLLSINSKYNLLDTINLKVKNQMDTNQCWAMATTTQLESYMAKVKSTNVEYSTRHIEYSTAKTFIDGINEQGHNREIDAGGNFNIAYAYLTSGRGPVIEEDMPFENNSKKIYLSEIEGKETVAHLKEFISFPNIYKETKNGEIIYSNGQTSGEYIEYTKDQIIEFRNNVKEHIMQYGSVLAVINAEHKEFFSNQVNFLNSKAYYCDNENIEANHQVAIVGWDDDYSIYNFNEEHRPKSTGAWIVQNSYGTQVETEDGVQPVFDNGYLYVSYDDYLIETYMSGIIQLDDIKYDDIYQYDPLGANDSIYTDEKQEMWLANVYKNKNEISYLTEVSFYNTYNEGYEIYINANNSALNTNDLVKVKSIGKTNSNYITVTLDNPVKITGREFVVCIKYIGNSEGVSAPVESRIENTMWETAKSNSGESYGSFDGNQWEDLINLQLNGRSNVNACIKAFTVDEYIEKTLIKTEQYEIEQNKKQIKKVLPGTNVMNFLNNFTSEDTLKVYDIYGNEMQENDIVGTGMELKLLQTNNSYKIVVVGDVNGDGDITATDLLKIKRDLVNIENLEEEYKQAGDVNFSGGITPSDLLQIKQVICKITNFGNF